MRVAVVAERAESNDGWGRYTVELVRSLRAAGVEPVLLTEGAELDAANAGVEHHAVMPPLFGARFSTLRQLRVASSLRPILATCDLVHNVVEPYLPLVARSCRPGQPLVQTAHGTWGVRPLTAMFSRAMYVRALRRVSLVVCQSRYTRDRMAALITMPRHCVLPAGVRAEDFARTETQAPLPPWTEGRRIALTVGAVKPRKGIHVAIDALAIARKALPDLHLAIVGTRRPASAYEEHLRERIDALGIEEAVHFVGRVESDALRAWYRRADVLLLPAVNDGNSFEGLGLVCLEAAACGTPAIASRDCGAADAVLDNDTGRLVPQNNPTKLAEAIVQIVGDNELRARMGAQALVHARALSWERLASELIKQYESMLATVSQPRRS